MTRYLDRALSGAPASVEEWNEHVVTFHAANPNMTPRMMAAFRTPEGLTSYDVLARHIQASQPLATRILDVGCGGGELLARIAARFGPALALYGVDLSPIDIESAQERLPNAHLLCADASQALPSGSFDAVVSHLSFLSMSRLRDALIRIRASLEPSGVLAFLLEDTGSRDSVFGVLADIMTELQQRFPRVAATVPDREPFENDDVLRAVLAETGFPFVQTEPVDLEAALAPSQLIDFAMMAYPFALLEEPLQSDLRERALSCALHRTAEEAAMAKLPLKLVTARFSGFEKALP